MSATVTVTEADFATVVEGSATPVLVDFWATWCGPCKMLAPVVEEIAAEYKGRITVAKVDLDKAPRLQSRLQIMSIPTLLLFHHGEVVGQITGAQPKKKIVKMITPFL